MELQKHILKLYFVFALVAFVSSSSASVSSSSSSLIDTPSPNLGVGENLYPCAHNQSVCKPQFDCWRAPPASSSFDRDSWICPPGFVDGCVCQHVSVLPVRCGPDTILDFERFNRRKTTESYHSPHSAISTSTRSAALQLTRNVHQKRNDTTITQCSPGLRCVTVNPDNAFPEPECISCKTNIPGMKYQLKDARNCNGKQKPIDGLESYLEPCSERNGTSVCKNDFECLSMEISGYFHYRIRPCTASRMTSASIGCFCNKPNGISNGQVCKASAECYVGHRCAKASFFRGGVCVSCLADSSILQFVDDGKEFCDRNQMAGETPQPEETNKVLPSPADETPPCIAVDALSMFGRDELVFGEHVQATVMCDVHGNCATPGHMVVYNDSPMMMKTYCALKEIQCRYRVKFVNSPRMKMGIRIPSMSDKFVYTAFAARHERLMEEYVLAAIVRANF